MEVLSCERCGLEIRIQAAYLRLVNCPRCLGRGAIVSPLTGRAVPGTPARPTRDPKS